MAIIKVGFVGDSITAGTNGDPAGQCITRLNALGYTATGTNRGISGTTSADWVPSGSNLGPAISAFTTAGVTVVHVMLGTNDTKTGGILPPAHAANMRLIVNALVAAGFKVVISKPLFTVGGSGGGQWGASPSIYYAQFFNLNLQLVDGVSVFQGDTGNYELSAANNALLADGIHPTGGFNTTVGDNWGVAIDQLQGLLRPLRGGFILTSAGYTSAPGVPTVTAAATSGTTVLVTVNAASGAATQTYSVQRSASSTFASGVTTLNGSLAYASGGATLTDTGLTAGTPYYYRASATNLIGTSGYSTIVSATPTVAATITVATPAGGTGNTTMALSGTYTATAPTGINYALDGSTSYTAATAFSASAGTWSANGIYVNAAGSHTVTVQEANASGVTATSASFSVTAGARTLPTVASASPAIWLDASRSGVLFSDAGTTAQTTNAGTVQTFVDATGTGRSVVQATAGNRPALAVSKVNGKNMIAFNGTTTSMATATGQTWVNAMRSGSPFTFRVVFITTANATQQGIVEALQSSSGTYKPGTDVYVDAGNTLNTNIFSGGANSTGSTTALNTQGTINHLVATYDGTTLKQRITSGGTDTTYTIADAGGTLDQLMIGFMPGVNWYLNGWFGEFAMWPGAATSAEVNALLTDAATWWGS